MRLFEKKIDAGSEWARLVLGDSVAPGLKISKSELEAHTKTSVAFRAKAISDDIKLVNNTGDARVFFQRYQRMLENMEWLAEIEKYYKFSRPLPSEQLKTVYVKREYTINDFIDRSYEKLALKIIKLKTEKARKKAAEDWFNELTFFSDKMEPENIAKYSEIYSRFNAN